MLKALKLISTSVYGIIIASILGILVGVFAPDFSKNIKIIGDLFVQLLRMVVLPIIIFGLLSAISKLSGSHNTAKTASWTIGYFVVASTVAGLFGVLIALVFNLGSDVNIPAVLLEEPKNLANTSLQISSVSDFLRNLIPTNPFNAIVSGNILQIVFFTSLLGVVLSYNANPNKQKVFVALDVINDALMLLIRKIMYLAPLGVFALMAYLLATTGLEILYTLLKLILVLILALFVWIYVVLGLVMALFTKVKYFDYVKTIVPLQLIAFSTASSMASIPTNVSVCDKLKLNQNIYRFVLPIGATIHMNGSALFYCVVTIFCANFFNIDLSISTYFIIAIVAMLGSIATPGVPGLSLTVVMVLAVAGVPLSALPLIIAVDRVLDMFITVANAVGDTVAASVVDKRLS